MSENLNESHKLLIEMFNQYRDQIKNEIYKVKPEIEKISQNLIDKFCIKETNGLKKNEEEIKKELEKVWSEIKGINNTIRVMTLQLSQKINIVQETMFSNSLKEMKKLEEKMNNSLEKTQNDLLEQSASIGNNIKDYIEKHPEIIRKNFFKFNKK